MALTLPTVAVVIAARNEAPRLPLLLADLAAAPELVAEVLVVDGASTDGTARLAALAGARVLASSPGRGRQLALGIASSRSSWVWLLHADVRLEHGWRRAVAAALAQPEAAWYCDLAIASAHPALRLVEAAVALRSRWRQLPYGDQGLLLPRRLLDRAGGMASIPLMEDLELVQRLRPYSRLRPLGAALRVDGRRWLTLGIWHTALANARLRRAWRSGAPAEVLAAAYYDR
ncbi:MAG: TIGR04283 family arsenosugar biosynthesis glycosyltransferase [Cyanobium sp.]